MKKVISLIAIGALTSLVACGGGEQPANPPRPEAPKVVEETPSTATETTTTTTTTTTESTGTAAAPATGTESTATTTTTTTTTTAPATTGAEAPKK